MDSESWFRTLAVASLADGVLDQQEVALLVRCATWLGLSMDRARAIVAQARAGSKETGAVPASGPERRRLLAAVLDVVFADGRLTPDEARCVSSIAETLAIPPEEVAAMVAGAQARWRFFAARRMPKTADEAGPLQPGTLVGDHFRIVEPLGEGGFAAVYKAHHEVLGVDVALKLLLPERIEKTAMAERRFLMEARIGRAVQHRHVVAVREVGRDPERGPYIAMDLVAGATLDALLECEWPRPRDRILRLALQVLEALDEAHRAGIVHRDVKPGNIMVTVGPTADEEARLLDFGIAKASWSHPDDARATTDGMIMGSLSYMSPEQAKGEKLDARSDLYSFAVVLYEALLGRLPYEISPEVEDICRAMIVAIVVDEPRSPRVLDESLPEPLARVMLRALAKRPADRPQTALELRDALRAAWADPPSPSPPTAP